MRLPLVTVLIAGLAWSFDASAQGSELKWSALQSLEQGSPGLCGSSRNPRWSIVVKNGLLEARSDGTASWHMSLKPLAADGSGAISLKSTVGATDKPVKFTFEPGQGPRKIRVHDEKNNCLWLWAPM